MEPKLIQVASIDTAHGLWHVRSYLEPRGQARLQEDMSVNGQRDPILVRPTPGVPGAYQIISGFRRLMAARQLGWSRVLISDIEASDAQAATLALAAELAGAQPQTYLERGWAAVRTQKLRAKAGLPSAIRPLADACGVKRSTMANAVRIGQVLPPLLVKSVADDLRIPVESIIGMPQKPMLAIVRSAPPYRPLLRAAVRAYLDHQDPSKAVTIAVSGREDGREQSRGVQQQWIKLGQCGLLRMKEPVSVNGLSPEESRRLAKELRRTAREVEATCPTGVQIVHRLDSTVRFFTGWARRIFRTVAQALSRVIERLK